MAKTKNTVNNLARKTRPGSDLRRRRKIETKKRLEVEVPHLGLMDDPDPREVRRSPLPQRERTRGWIARYLLIAASVAIAASVIFDIGLRRWDTVPYVAKWSGLLIAAVVLYYLPHRKNE